MGSDGTGFGSLSVDRSDLTAFQRWDYDHPERNLEISVFPHGHVKKICDGIEAIATRRHRFVSTRDWEAERSVPLILNVDPWKNVRTDMPRGYYPGAEGMTIFGARRWSVQVAAPGGHGRVIHSFVDLSYVSWHFEGEVDDFSTSIVARIRPSYATVADVALIADKTNALLKDLQHWLERAPLDELQMAPRRDLDAKLARQAEDVARGPVETLDDQPAAPGPGADYISATAPIQEQPQEIEVTVQFPKNRK